MRSSKKYYRFESGNHVAYYTPLSGYQLKVDNHFFIYKNGLSWRSRFTEQYICESFTSTVYSDILLYPLKHFKAHSDINENNQQCYERIA